MPIVRTGRRGRPATLWATFAAAIVVHGTVLGTVHALGMSVVGDGFGIHRAGVTRTTAGDVDAENPEVHPSCVGDVLLASSARVTLCFAPWRGDTDACLDDAQSYMWIDLSSCQARNDPSIASVAMLAPHAADKLKPIDPEQLLDQPDPAKPPPPPPPVVPPPQPEQQPAQPKPPAPPAQPRPLQVVETAKPTTEQAPDSARFLAEYDTAVKHQTVARGARNEPMVAKSQAEELTAKKDPKEASIKEVEDRPRGIVEKAADLPGKLSMRSPGVTTPAETEQDARVRGSTIGGTGPLALDGYVPRKGDGAIEQQRRERSEIPRGQGGAGGGAPDIPNLKPSQDVLERALGGGSVDHLEQIESGDETALSAKKFLYASFFNRLKRSVAQNWDPQSVWRRSDPTGQVYGFKTRVTEVRVSLSGRGELEKIVVTTPCGVGDLDDEAVRAFHAAGPFPNPPKELVASDHLITFAFSFYFEIGAPHTSWRVIRSM